MSGVTDCRGVVDHGCSTVIQETGVSDGRQSKEDRRSLEEYMSQAAIK